MKVKRSAGLGPGSRKAFPAEGLHAYEIRFSEDLKEDFDLSGFVSIQPKVEIKMTAKRKTLTLTGGFEAVDAIANVQTTIGRDGAMSKPVTPVVIKKVTIQP